jgi:hypothetical protein
VQNDATRFRSFFGPGGQLDRFFHPDDPVETSAIRWCFDNCPGFVRQKLERLQSITGVTDPNDARLKDFYCPRCL